MIGNKKGKRVREKESRRERGTVSRGKEVRGVERGIEEGRELEGEKERIMNQPYDRRFGSVLNC